jgi:hypothetical protein
MRFFFIFWLALAIFPIKSAHCVDVLASGYEAMQAGNYKEAYQEFLPIAELDNPKAQYYLGHFYEKGLVDEQDYEKAFKWYEKSAKLEHLESMLKVAWMYETGKAKPINYVKAKKWYEKASQKGNGAATRRLATYSLSGKSDFVDVKKAYELLKKAVEQGDEKSQQLIDNNLKIQEYILGNRELKGDEDPVKEGPRLVLDEAKYMINRFLNYGMGSYYLDVRGNPSIVEQAGRYKVIVPKVKFTNEDGDYIRIGNVIIDVVEDGADYYKINVVLPKRITVLNKDDDVIALIAPGNQFFDGRWSKKLHLATDLNVKFSDLVVSSVSSVLTFKIDNIHLDMATVELSDGVLDVNNVLSIDNLKSYSSLGEKNPLFAIKNIEFMGKTSDLDIVKYREKSQELNDFFKNLSKDDKNQNIELLAGKKIPKFVPFWNKNQASFKISGISIKPVEGKGGFYIDDISMVGVQNDFKKPLNDMSFKFDISGLKSDIKTSIKLKNANFPKRVKLGFSILNLPIVNIVNKAFDKLPEILQKIQEEQKKLEKTTAQKMATQDVLDKDLNTKEEMSVSNDVNLEQMPSMPVMMFAGLSETITNMVMEAGLTFKIDDFSVEAEKYDIGVKGAFAFEKGAKSLGVGEMKISVFGFDELIKQTTPEIKVKKSFSVKEKGAKKVEMQTVNNNISPLYMLIPYRMIANKKKDEKGRLIEEFVVDIPKNGKVTLNGKVMFPDSSQNNNVGEKNKVNKEMEDKLVKPEIVEENGSWP